MICKGTFLFIIKKYKKNIKKVFHLFFGPRRWFQERLEGALWFMNMN